MATPNYFMWGFQQHFLIGHRVLFEALLRELGCPINFSMFLIGFRTSENAERWPVCVEPKDCGYNPALFEDAYDDVMANPANPPSTTDPNAGDWHVAGHAYRSFVGRVQEAIDEVLREHAGGGRLTYTSVPCQVGEFAVCLVVQICAKDYDALPHLRKEVSEEQGGVQPSLLASVNSVFLDYAREELTKPEPGQYLAHEREPTELLRAAGKRFSYTAAAAGKEFYGLHGLFEACNVISSLRYEGAEGAGHLVVARKGHPALEVRVEFADPAPLSNYRAVRKLLQLCGENTWLLTNSHLVYGLGGVKPNAYDPGLENLFVIRFVKHHCWELLHAGQILMRTTYGEPRLPIRSFDEDRFKAMLDRVIPGVEAPAIKEFVRLAHTAAGAKHGTMLVISSDAEQEAKRLEKQGFRIRPVPLGEEQLALATKIDGAVLLDRTGVCHAFGIVLDGKASPNGTPARGARFNSAVRYAEEKKNCVILVVSEDGMVDVLPDLRLRIRKKDLVQHLADLEYLSKQEAVGHDEYLRVMTWLNEHRFYLSAEACRMVNATWPEVEKKLPQDAWKRSWDAFEPHPELDESYFTGGER
jgi:DNA integrity scanning protein DisA with diadenylate cyclase activity